MLKIVACMVVVGMFGCAQAPPGAATRETTQAVAVADFSSGYGVQRHYRTITGGNFTISADQENDGRLEGYYRVNTTVFDSFVNLTKNPVPPDGSIVTITRTIAPDVSVVVLDDLNTPIAWLDNGKQGWATFVYSAVEHKWLCAAWSGFYVGP